MERIKHLCGKLEITHTDHINDTYNITCPKKLHGDRILLWQSTGEGTGAKMGDGWHCIHIREIKIYGTYGKPYPLTRSVHC